DKLWTRAHDAKFIGPHKPLDAAQEELRQLLYGVEAPANVSLAEIEDYFFIGDKKGRDELNKLQKALDQLVFNPGAPPHALILEDKAVPYQPRVFLRGNSGNLGEAVPRQFLHVLAGDNRKPFENGSGRLELAQAIVSKDNPLTARVLVNRV